MSADSDEINRKAADWAAKREFRPLSAAEQAEFDAWLKADVRHLGAFGRSVAALVRLKDAYSAVPGAPAAALPPSRPLWSRRRMVLAGSMAASVALVLGVAPRFWRPERKQEFSTSIGQVREILLSDRSVVTLNTASRISVNFTSELREIHLLEGEAHFDVAKNKARPFVVWAGDTSVRAVGTSFTVSVLPKQPTQILVKEGVVEVKRAGLVPSSPLRAGANTKVIAPAQSAIVAAAVPQTSLARYTAWQYGRVAFEDEMLKDAAAEFARYSEVRITVDPDVADKRITGIFVSSDPVGFAKATASALDLDVEVGAKEVRIFNRGDTSR
jgi:transmembrane sensor